LLLLPADEFLAHLSSHAVVCAAKTVLLTDNGSAELFSRSCVLSHYNLLDVGLCVAPSNAQLLSTTLLATSQAVGHKQAVR
jgi:hypothetical protein